MLSFCFMFLFVINFFNDAQLVYACGPDEFPCNDGSCVEKNTWCDSRSDCDDDSDEYYCFFKSGLISNPNRCNLTLFFLCNDGRCIPSIGRCDGYSSCEDNSDEENCDAAVNALHGSDNVTVLPTVMETTQKTIKLFNSNESKPFQNLHENKMQADHIAHMEIEENKSIYSSKLNTSEHFSTNTISKIDHHNVLEANATNVEHVSENFTNENSEVRYKISKDHKPALEFRDLFGKEISKREKGKEISLEKDSLKNEQNMTNPVTTNPLEDILISNETLISDYHVEDEQVADILHSRSQSHHSKLPESKKSEVAKSTKNIFRKEEDMYKGYAKLNTREYRNYKEKALQWLINVRDKDYGWGEETARALITLEMADFTVGKPVDAMLMSKQLHLKLFTLLSRNDSQRIPLGELGLYINALSASCDNPKNFYGHNLVDILRHRANSALMSSKLVSPFVYLVLCLNNASTLDDVIAVRDMLYDPNVTKTDSEALISLAATCMSRIPKLSDIDIGKMAARRLYNKIKATELPRNVYELALLIQALNEAKVNQDLWNRTEAMRRITDLQEKTGSFGDILSTYYAVPTLSGKSFLWLSNICHIKDSGLIPLEILKNGKDEKMYVHYSLRFGNPVEMSQSLTLKVQKNTNFLDIMRLAAAINPTYKFKYDVTDGKLIVYSIGGIANDAERGLYWIPYVSMNSTKELVSFEGDIRHFIPNSEEYVAFWRKPMY